MSAIEVVGAVAAGVYTTGYVWFVLMYRSWLGEFHPVILRVALSWPLDVIERYRPD